MKISIDVDITPLEMRKLMGLPDMEAFHQELMDELRAQMAAGAEGYDPLNLLQPYITSTFASWDAFRKLLAGTGGGAVNVKSTGDGTTEK